MLFHGFLGVDGLSVDISTMVDIRDQSNKELSMRLSTDIKSDDIFYTDLNGFQVRTPPPTDGGRKICFSSQTVKPKPVLFDLFSQIQPRRFYQKLPLQGNFYPISSQAYIQDSQHRLTLHTAQALGVTSFESGLSPIT